MFLTLAFRGALVAAALLLVGCDDIHDTTLDNGMRVIVKEDHRSPVVVSMVWYKVGSIDEPKGLTGISHVLEHMMFKGTERLKPNEFSRIVAANGGRENAFTNYDYTAYFQQLEKSRLPIAFELEAERMRNLTLDPEETRKEVQVVMEERRLRTEDQPEAKVYEEFMAEAYRVHPYHHPVIGWMEDLERITPKDLRAWYSRWYTPNNATLVVVGDVQPTDVVALAQKHFGPIPRRPVERPAIPSEPPQKETRRTTVSAQARVPYLLLGFHTPVLSDDNPRAGAGWEPYALSVLAGVLDGGDSARFERELIREQRIAAGISTDYNPIARDPGMLLFGGTPADGRSVAELEAALRAQLERLKKEPVSEAELKRVKAQVTASDVYSRDSVFYQAMLLGRLAMAGLELELIEERVRRINRVTAEEVMQVAKKYLDEGRMTVAVLEPEASAEAAKKDRRGPARTEAGHAR